MKDASKFQFTTLQWHVTGLCNFCCKHCYEKDGKKSFFTLEKAKKIWLEYVDFLEKNKLEGRVLLAGGEPFMWPYLFDFLSWSSRHQGRVRSFGILTNGSLLSLEKIKFIEKNAPILTNIQISVEGPEEINDAIRGEGSFQKVLSALSLIKQNSKISVHLSATLSRMNYPQVFDLLDVLLIYNVPLRIRRFVPIGRGKNDVEKMLSPEELKEFYEKAYELNANKLKDSKSQVFETGTVCSSGLKYLIDSKKDYWTCGVGRSLSFSIDSDGEVYRCRLIPKSVGNIHKNSLVELAEGIKKFNQSISLDPECQSCPLVDKCHGGARCIAAAVTGNISARDPQCWRKTK